MKILVTTVPFAEFNDLPRELLDEAHVQWMVNPHGRKIKTAELAELVGEVDILIAGTERIDKTVFDRAPNLRLICRVGIGLDGIDLNEAASRGIKVSFTPEAPAPAVAELTIGLMLSLLRNIHLASNQIKNGVWQRLTGRRIPEITIGVIGAGRIGGRVIRRLSSFGSPRILVNDLSVKQITDNLKLEWVSKETIYREADLITVHVPLTVATRNLIDETELAMMKRDALLINTARGGIINETALRAAILNERIAGCAIDVFESEPYHGPLCDLEKCLLTAHMGSMTQDCRAQMEIQATEEALRFVRGEPLSNEVPEFEYRLQEIAG